ncbi:uncharacterized protein LOC116255145 [Nymphaea colorata]|nr:uncharacterized protein LOC116255145 [Nymphaea colorata]
MPFSLPSAYPLPIPSSSKRFNRCTFPVCSRSQRPFICSALRPDEISEIVHNKVLISSTAAAALGQFSKPFTSALNGKGVDFRAAMRSGGMPSVHSASVIAAATAIGLERGFADPIFGLSVVFAAIVMYDAQGVRKEVGAHAKVINSRLLGAQSNRISLAEGRDTLAVVNEFDSRSTGISKETNAPLLSPAEELVAVEGGSEAAKFRATMLNKYPSNVYKPEEIKSDVMNDGAKMEQDHKYVVLKESVGHTESEVLAGAVFGFLIAIIVGAIL